MKNFTICVGFIVSISLIGFVAAQVTGGKRGQTGACCLPGGKCMDLSEPDCDTAGGFYQGDSTICQQARGTPVICQSLGACCLPDGECLDNIAASVCESQGGLAQGEGAFCANSGLAGNVTCENRIGACCVDDLGCLSHTTAEICISEFGGTFMGVDTFCLKPAPFSAFAGSSQLGQFGVLCDSPVNDLCQNAIPIDTFGSFVFGTVDGATFDDVPLCLDNRLGLNGVWYSVIGTGSVLSARLCAIPDPGRGGCQGTIMIYCGGCNNLQCRAGDTRTVEFCGARGGLDVSWCSAPDEEYLIFVALDCGTNTSFGLTVTDTEKPCEYMECGVLNDECEDAILIDSEGFYFGSTIGATFDDVEICANPDGLLAPGVWYKVIGTGNVLEMSLCRGMFERGVPVGEINVYCGSCDALNCITGDAGILPLCQEAARGKQDDDVSVSWCSAEGVEYFIQVMYPSGSGEFVLEYRISELCENPPPCATADNDFCEDAEPICPGVIYMGNTFEATNDYLDHGAPISTVFFCGPLMALYDNWYSYTPSEAGLLFVHVEQLPTEWVFGVYDDCPEFGGTLLKCNTTRHHGVIIVQVQPYHTYYIRIAGFLESRGTYIMDILGPPCVPTN